MTEQEIRDIARQAMREVVSAKNAENDMEEIKTAIESMKIAISELQEVIGGGEGMNGKGKGKNAEEEEAAKLEEEKAKEEKEGATLENAKPSQEMVKAFSTAFNTDFGAKTPSFATLAAMSGIKETDAALRISAVNAKFAEMQKSTPAASTAQASSEVF